jgi:hypothetical protein
LSTKGVIPWTGVVAGPMAEDRESGQAAVGLLLVCCLLMLGGMGFAVDLANLWLHRQAAQVAADSACQAGAMDLLAKAGGASLPSMGFTPGTASDCTSSPSSTICAYAGFNGYSGTGSGSSSNTAWNTVSWTFPASVAGATPPPSSQAGYPFLRVNVTENLPTYFLPIFTGSVYQKLGASCTCGLVQEQAAAPVLVLQPSMSNAFSYSGGGQLAIVGGPSRSLQVNSTSSTAVYWAASGIIDTSRGGPAQTGSDVAIVGGPAIPPTNGSSNGFNGGSTGQWRSGVLPIIDPYGMLGPPVSMKSVTPLTYNSKTGAYNSWAAYHQDGCPDTQARTGQTGQNCIEFAPGYYPQGLNIPSLVNNYSTVIFLPGIYYLNGSLVASGSNTLRVATPCTPACSSTSAAAGLSSHTTDGAMFYFLSGSFNVSGCSGCSSSSIDPVPSTTLTCDGSTPNASLGMPSTINGNVLYAQCTQKGTYWDSAGDTSDTVGNPGTRGILFFEDHGDAASPNYSGSGSLAFAGSLYLHSSGYADVLNMSGGSSNGTFILGNIVADQINISGSAVIKLALNPAPSVEMTKAAILQ